MAEYLLNLRATEPTTIGNSWMRRFLQTRRAEHLRVILSKPIEHSRHKASTLANFQAWFDVYSTHKELFNIRESDIYNADETGFRMGDTGRAYVVVDKEEGYTGYTPMDRGESLTVIECGCADGSFIPPFVIFKGNHLQSTWLHRSVPHDWMAAVSPKGWTSNVLGLRWLVENFKPRTRAKATGRYRMLILDGHGSHLAPEFVRHCFNNRIALLCLPAHTSHMLQPLDLKCFGPLKAYYRNETANIMRKTRKAIPKVDFMEIYQRTRPLAMTAHNIKARFKSAGLIPFSPIAAIRKLPQARILRPESSKQPLIDVEKLVDTPHNTRELREASLAFSVLSLRSPLSRRKANEIHKKIVKGAEEGLTKLAIREVENEELAESNEKNRKGNKGKRVRIQSGRCMTVGAAWKEIEKKEKEKATQATWATRARKQPSPTPEPEFSEADSMEPLSEQAESEWEEDTSEIIVVDSRSR
jgi:hypothetical protein